MWLILKNNQQTIFLFFLIGAFVPYFYLSFFAQPMAEDFGFSFYYQTNELWGLLKMSYFKMNGRYISNLLMYLNPLSFNSFFGYKIVPTTMLLLMFLGNYLLIKKTISFLSKTKKLIIALALTLLYFQNMPIISEGLYWYTSAVIYQGGIIVVLFYMSMFVSAITTNKYKNIQFLALTLLLFISCGFNEVLTLLIVFGLALISILFYINNKEKKTIVLMQLIFAILFAAILIFSPGNKVREAMYIDNHQLFHSGFYTLLQTVRFSFYWVFSVPLIAASILYYPIHNQWEKHSTWVNNSFFLNKWISLFLLFAIIFICVFPAYWITGILGQHRTLNVAYFFFLIMWFINLSVWFNSIKKGKQFSFSKKSNSIIAIIFFLGIVFTGNGYSGLDDISSGKASQFNNQLNQRNLVLLKAKKSPPKQILFLPIVAKPKTLFVSDISINPGYWMNLGYNTYFRLDSTKISIKKYD